MAVTFVRQLTATATRLAHADPDNRRRKTGAARIAGLGNLCVVFSIGPGGAELLKLDVDRIALPLGCVLFVYLIGLRLWSAREPAEPTYCKPIAATQRRSDQSWHSTITPAYLQPSY
jgi:hypothetical protein